MSSQDTPSPNSPPLRFLRMKDVEDRVGLNKRTIQRMVKAETFPEPIRLHERSIGFVESEVAAWMEARMADRPENGDE
jgi:prophage regulatory protein